MTSLSLTPKLELMALVVPSISCFCSSSSYLELRLSDFIRPNYTEPGHGPMETSQFLPGPCMVVNCNAGKWQQVGRSGVCRHPVRGVLPDPEKLEARNCSSMLVSNFVRPHDVPFPDTKVGVNGFACPFYFVDLRISV
ncbi:hypothetical protein L6452_12157 [Arctium lappa]|uniref:Uncharacterized protein n=1 Tax=Arctium lappa TaxID=4217 RepID=A0ACB9DQ74_ARCLA|nr:hypothetical protein L6452_12157 [Arctium lappa]